MNFKRRLLVAAVAALSLLVVLVGCGSNDKAPNDSDVPKQADIVAVTLEDGTQEEMTCSELCELANDNPVAFERYLGCPIDITAEVISIEKAHTTDGHKMDGGSLLLGSFIEFEFQASERDVVSSLSKGDVVHATGCITHSFGRTVFVWYYADKYSPKTGLTLDSTPTHIEKIAS